MVSRGLGSNLQVEANRHWHRITLHCQIDNPDPSRKTKRVSGPQCLPGGECCSTAVLSARDDFHNTPSRLQEIMQDGGIFLLYPKPHCELNWIEHYWGSCKCFARKHCNHTLAGKLRLGVRIRRNRMLILSLAVGLREVVNCSLICKR